MNIIKAAKECKKFGGIIKRESIKTIHFEVRRRALIGFLNGKEHYRCYPTLDDILATDWIHIQDVMTITGRAEEIKIAEPVDEYYRTHRKVKDGA